MHNLTREMIKVTISIFSKGLCSTALVVLTTQTETLPACLILEIAAPTLTGLKPSKTKSFKLTVPVVF